MRNKTIKNSLLLSSANIVARLIGLLYFILLGRLLGVEYFGHYNFAIALVYNFYPVADFGVERLILRDLSRNSDQSQEYFQKLIPLRFFLAVISIFLLMGLGSFLAKSSFDRINIFLFSLCLIPWTFNQLVAGIGNAFEKMWVQSAVIICMSLTNAVIGGIIALLGGNVTQILASAVVANLMVSVIVLNLARKIGLKFNLVIDIGFCKKALSESWIFACITIVAVFYLRASVIMVNQLKGAYYTGVYSSAFKFIEASILIPQSFALALFPQMARLLVSEKDKLRMNYFKSLGVTFVFSILYFLLFYCFAPTIIKFSYGELFFEAIPVLKVLSFGSILLFLNTLPGNVIQSSNKMRAFLPFYLLSFLTAVFLGIVLIPRYSIIGAGWAVVGGEAVNFLVNNIFVLKILRINKK